MRKQRDGAGRARTDADAAAQGKRRKSSRARSGATSQPKLTGQRRRREKPAAAIPETQIVAASPQPSEAPAEVRVAPAISAETADAAFVTDRQSEAVSPGDDGCSQPGRTTEMVEVPPVPLPNPSSGPEVHFGAPAPSSDIIGAPSRSRGSRSSVTRWAAAAAILAVCLLALGRLSDTQVSAYAVPASSEAARPIALTETASQAGLPSVQEASLPSVVEAGPLPDREASLPPLQQASPLPEPVASLPPIQVAALVPPSTSVLPVAPSDAEQISQSAAAPIAPSAKARVPARDKAPAARAAKLRKPVRKAGVPETAPVPPPVEPAQAQLTGRAHAPGRYEMRWGTARLHEDPNSDRAEGPSWDFVAGAGAR